MATYKVLQDIEAEDKLVGPLTLRQCIYAAVGAVCAWLSWLCIARGFFAGVFFFLPFIGTAVFFAFPWKKEQSTEVWALAKVRFSLKPRKRIWDQTAAKDLVTITAPKRAVQAVRRRLSEDEVRGRLKALAETVDSRGWAVKNVPLDMYLRTGAAMPESDRLVGGTNLPTNVNVPDAVHSNDMFDLAANPLAQQFEEKMSAAASAHRQELVKQVENPSLAPPQAPAGQGQQWFASQPQQPPTNAPSAVDPNMQDLAVAEEIKRKQQLLHDGHGVAYGHMRVIQPLDIAGQPQPAVASGSGSDPARPDLQANFGSQSAAMPAAGADPVNLAAQAAQLMGGAMPAPGTTPQQAAPAYQQAQTDYSMPIGQVPTPLIDEALQASAPVTALPNPAILELANNNDLDVATIAREAKRQTEGTVDEVVVSLH